MTAISYHQLALSWSLENRSDRLFNIITIVVLVVSVMAALIVSSIDVPEETRLVREIPPPRVIEFLLEKKKQQPKKEIEKIIPPPKPEPRPIPKPVEKSEPKPKVEKIKDEPKDKKPLSRKQKEGREKAQDSGLLALSNELADLIDTDDISAMVGGSLNRQGSASTQSDNAAAQLLLSASTQGSGGIVGNDNAPTIVTTALVNPQREVTTIEQKLVTSRSSTQQPAKKTEPNRKGGIRSEESVTLVFDRNKSKLHQLYDRARRKNPGLKGKIILEITIAPSGKVDRIVIVKSELNDKTLESRLLKRIKQFDFGAQAVEQVTVTFPVEFLPS